MAKVMNLKRWQLVLTALVLTSGGFFIHAITTPKVPGLMQKDEVNSIYLRWFMQDGKDTYRKTGRFEVVRGIDAYQTEVKLDMTETKLIIQSAGKDRIFNTNDDETIEDTK